jgi:hypothetical protein
LSRGEEYQWVSRGGKRYLRRRPYTYDNPSTPQRRIRALFGLSAYKARDRFGKARVTGRDGVEKEVPIPAATVQEELKGEKIPVEKPAPPATVYPKYVRVRVEDLLEALRLVLKS